MASTTNDPPAIIQRQPGRLRRVAFRMAAVAMGLLPLLTVEWMLAALDVGRPADYGDPFAGFSSIQPLFVLDEASGRYEIANSRQTFFYSDSFAAQKAPDEYRVFCLGGSTVQGRPFAIDTSFSTFVELGLAAAQPERRWEVVNCGGVSYASYRLVPVFDEVLRYEPDLIILYTGHNEFLEDRTYDHIKNRPEWLQGWAERAFQLRTVTLARAGLERAGLRAPPRLASDRPILPTEVDARLDHTGGLARYHHDAKWRRDVMAHYRLNLRRMIDRAQRAGVPLMLVNPACNLRDCPPFKSGHRSDLTTAERARWDADVQAARRLMKANKFAAIDRWKRAIDVDPQYAATHYQLAECYDALDMHAEALAAYEQARDWDVCPLRILEPMNQSVLEVARATDTPLIDFRAWIEEHSADGIAGGDWFIDHVHPTIRGHQQLANLILDDLARRGVVEPRANWETRREAAYEAHVASLDELYFLKGAQRLRNVRMWAQGLVKDEEPLPGGDADDERPPAAATADPPM